MYTNTQWIMDISGILTMTGCRVQLLDCVEYGTVYGIVYLDTLRGSLTGADIRVVSMSVVSVGKHGCNYHHTTMSVLYYVILYTTCFMYAHVSGPSKQYLSVMYSLFLFNVNSTVAMATVVYLCW